MNNDVISIEKKLAAISGTRVPRTEKGVYGNFATMEDIHSVVDPLLKDANLAVSCMPTTEGGRSGVTLFITDLDTGYQKSSTVTSNEQRNKFVKGQGEFEKENPFMEVGKNLTYLTRYAWAVGLGLDWADDPEKTGKPVQKQAPKQAPKKEKPFVAVSFKDVMDICPHIKSAPGAEIVLKDLHLEGTDKGYARNVISEYEGRYNIQTVGVEGEKERREIHANICKAIVEELKAKGKKE